MGRKNLMINIYSEKEIEELLESGKILSLVLRAVAKMVKPGVTTKELDVAAEKQIRAAGGAPAFLNYHEGNMKPYPASLCTSINDELVHCVPYVNRKIKECDIVSLDLGVKYKNMNTDMALTVAVGEVSKEVVQMLKVTEQSLQKGIEAVKPGNTVGDIGHAVESFVKEYKFGIIRDLVGHGVGKNVHEEPRVPNYGKAGTGVALKPGMVIAIEPMLTLGGEKIKLLPDGFGITTADGSLSAHFEKTVAVTDSGYKIITP